MQIEAGKYYKTRDGRKAYVVRDDKTEMPFDVMHFKEDGSYKNNMWHYNDGSVNIGNGDDYDLISEWKDDTTASPHAELAELAAKYGICITVSAAYASITYDGRYESNHAQPTE